MEEKILDFEKVKINELEEEKRKKYNPDNIFKKHEVNKNVIENVTQNTVTMVEYKEPILKKIINKIKGIFDIN